MINHSWPRHAEMTSLGGGIKSLKDGFDIFDPAYNKIEYISMLWHSLACRVSHAAFLLWGNVLVLPTFHALSLLYDSFLQISKSQSLNFTPCLLCTNIELGLPTVFFSLRLLINESRSI